jgi:hypothetical protein
MTTKIDLTAEIAAEVWNRFHAQEQPWQLLDLMNTIRKVIEEQKLFNN